MSDFSDRPLVAASLTGMRSFVDSLGRLTGVSHHEVWRPGVNEAECLAAKSVRYGPTMQSILDQYYRTTINPQVAPATEPKEPAHQVASLSCACGYYAYFDNGANPYHDGSENLLGVVAATGVATVGTRGFRAQKAEVVALVGPTSSQPHLSSRWIRLCDWTQGRGRDDLISGVSIFGMIGGFAAAVACAAANIAHVWAILPTLLLVASAVMFRASVVGFNRSLDREYRLRCDRAIDPAMVALVRRNYPDVPFYDSIEAAVKAHPLTFVPPPSPETDDDFWTRSAS